MKKNCGKFSVMNTSYMNDPNEGLTIKRLLYDGKLPQEESERQRIENPYIFIKCFTSMVDYLPMWQMYGNSGKGVCLVCKWEDSTNNLYRVCYVGKSNNGTYAVKNDNPELANNDINAAIKELKNIIVYTD